MIEIHIRSQKESVDELSKHYMIVFLSFNSTQKRILSQAAMATGIKGDKYVLTFRDIPAMRSLAEMIVVRMVERTEADVVAIVDDEVLFSGTIVEDKPPVEPLAGKTVETVEPQASDNKNVGTVADSEVVEGKVSDVRVYDKALTQKEVKDAMKAGKKPKTKKVSKKAKTKVVSKKANGSTKKKKSKTAKKIDLTPYMGMPVNEFKKISKDKFTQDDLKRILKAEQVGKKRKTMIKYLENLITRK